MIRLFNYDKGVLSLNIEELKLFSEFKYIFTIAYNKTEGDVNGTNRIIAYRICTYAFLYHDWRSPYVDYDDKSKHLKCCKELGILDIKFDNHAKAAINKYKELLLEYAPSINALQNLRTTLRLLDKTIDVRLKKINELSNKLNEVKISTEDEDSLNNYIAYTRLIDDEISKILPMGKQIKLTYNDIEDLEEQVKRELSETKLSRGGKKIGNRADPND